MGGAGKGVTAPPPPGRGRGDPDSGRGSGDDPGLGGRGLAGLRRLDSAGAASAPGWAGRVGGAIWSPRGSCPQPASAPAVPGRRARRSPGAAAAKVSRRGPHGGRIGVPWSGAETSESLWPAPDRRHHTLSKPELLPVVRRSIPDSAPVLWLPSEMGGTTWTGDTRSSLPGLGSLLAS